MVNFEGKTFGRLTVTKEATRNEKARRWWCSCECGNTKIVLQAQLSSGRTQSCGCLRREMLIDRNTIHGQSKTRTWNIWQSMISRCKHVGCTSYPRYGAVGVTVCDRWSESYENFLADMGEAPDGLSIERKNGAKVYSPENCTWATPTEQARSRSTTIWVTHEGKTLCLKDWARELNLDYVKLYKRYIVRGWSFERAIGC